MDQKLLINKMVAHARSYVGVPWRHRGRTHFGVDCLGVVINACLHVAIPIQDRRNYGREPWKDGLERELESHFGQALHKSEIQAGDIVLMRGEGQPEPGHVGMIGEQAGELTLIHSFNADSNSKACEHRIDEAWMKRIVKVYRPIK